MYSAQVCDAAMRQLSRRRSEALATADARRYELFARVPRFKEIENELSAQGAQLGKMALSGGSFAQQLQAMQQRNLALQKEQEDMLRQLGLPANYLEPPYYCPLCEDTGYVEGKRCQCLSSLLRVEASKVGKDLDQMIKDDQNLGVVAKSVTVDVVARALMTSTTQEPMTQMSESAGGYSFSGNFLVPGGGLFIKKSELARLGLRRQKYGVIEPYGND